MKRFCMISMITLVGVVLAAFLFLLPQDVQAAEIASGTCGNNLTWTLDDQGTLTISGTGNMASYASQGAPWFSIQNVTKIKKVVIEEGVTSIGNYAFAHLSAITEITTPSTVTKIGEHAFVYCKALQSFIIPDGVRTIPEFTFSNCTSLTTIVIPSTVRSFGDMAFNNCSSIEYIIIPDGVTTLPFQMFSGCSGLEYVGIPSTVTRIHPCVFDDCGNLCDVYYAGTETQFKNIQIDSYGNEALRNATIHYSSKAPCRTHAYGNYTNVSDTQHSRTCANCGYKETVSHSWDGGTVTKAATCTKTGVKTYTCTACSATKTETIDKTAHTYDHSCDPNCNICGATRTITHTYDKGQITQAATCTLDGVKTYTCTVCKETKTETVKATGHSYQPTVTAPTCTEQGYTTHTCASCGDSYKNDYVAANGHSLGAWYVAEPATCTDTGLERRDCSNCDHIESKEIEVKGHSYRSKVTAPTCTDQGYTNHTCSDCGDSYVDEYVAASGHADGNNDYFCDICNKNLCTNHVEVLIPGESADCNKSGLTDGKKCGNCGEILQEQEVIPALGHSYSEWAQVKAPTTTETGLEERVCSVCGQKEQHETPKLDPTPTEPQATKPTKEPNDDDGNATIIIAVCAAIGGLGIGGAAVLIVLKKKK